MPKQNPKKETTRKERITMEIVVDAYDKEERAMGWYSYLDEQLHFPFPAQCRKKRPIFPAAAKYRRS